MLNNQDIRAILKSMPLEDLNIGTRLFRVLKNNSVPNLLDAFMLDEADIEELFRGPALKEYDNLFFLYENNPNKLLEVITSPKQGSNKRPAGRNDSERRQRKLFDRLNDNTLAQIPQYSRQFEAFEQRSRLALASLDDHREEALIAECFGELSASIVPAESDFIAFFQRRHRKGDIDDFASVFPIHFSFSFPILQVKSSMAMGYGGIFSRGWGLKVQRFRRFSKSFSLRWLIGGVFQLLPMTR